MSHAVKTWSEWLKKSRFSYMSDEQKEQTLRWLMLVRDKVLTRANIDKKDTVIDIGTGTGLLAFGAYDLIDNNGKIIAMDVSPDCLEECKKIAQECNIENNLEMLISDVYNINLPDNYINVAMFRSVLVHVLNKKQAFSEIYRILKTGGRLSFFEPVISSNTKYHELISPNIAGYDEFKKAEIKMMTDEQSPLTNFNENTLKNDMISAGFKNINFEINEEKSIYTAKAEMIEPWFNTPTSPGSPTLKEKFLKYFDENTINNYIEIIKKDLDGKEITVNMVSVYGYAEK